MFNILIVDDHEELRGHLAQLFEQEGYRVLQASTGEEALERMREQKFAIVVSDVQMPNMDGIELTRHVREKHADTDIILITGFGNVQQAVEAMKLGASDYISKPFQPEVIRFVIEKLIEKRRLRDEILDLRQRLSEGYSLGKMLGRSRKMTAVFGLIQSLAETDSGVMITGETGTGKELAARAIHDLSARKERNFVPINCGAFPETLLEGELFGYEKGPLLAPSKPIREKSKLPMAARFSSTRLKTSQRRCRSSCCGCSRNGKSSVWAAIAKSKSICG